MVSVVCHCHILPQKTMDTTMDHRVPCNSKVEVSQVAILWIEPLCFVPLYYMKAMVGQDQWISLLQSSIKWKRNQQYFAVDLFRETRCSLALHLVDLNKKKKKKKKKQKFVVIKDRVLM